MYYKANLIGALSYTTFRKKWIPDKWTDPILFHIYITKWNQYTCTIDVKHWVMLIDKSYLFEILGQCNLIVGRWALDENSSGK